jgi:hypothetical protein
MMDAIVSSAIGTASFGVAGGEMSGTFAPKLIDMRISKIDTA